MDRGRFLLGAYISNGVNRGGGVTKILWLMVGDVKLQFEVHIPHFGIQVLL